MDTSDPLIHFDDVGVCNHCHDYEGAIINNVHSGKEGLRQLRVIVEQIKRDGTGKRYDCIIGVSGGVDSTFVAWKVKEFGLRALAVHLDNGWDSEIAVSNISSVLKKVGFDLYTHVIDWEEFKDIQRAFLLASTPDAEIPSDHAIIATMHQVAARFEIQHVISGMNVRTEMHLPSSWSQGHGDWGYIRAVHRRFGNKRIRTFPHLSFSEFLSRGNKTRQTTNLLDYLDYSKKDALLSLQRELGWKDYGGKHYESIYTRWFQGCYLPRKFGYDKRRSHLSSLICSAEITRENALEELKRPAYPVELQQQDCEYVAKKLEFTQSEFAAVMTAKPRRFEDYPSFKKFRGSQRFKMARGIYRLFRHGEIGTI